MSGTSSPIEDIIGFIFSHLGFVIVLVIAFFSWIVKAMGSSAKPPGMGPGATARPTATLSAPAAVPRPRPSPLSPPSPGATRPAAQFSGGQRFRAQLPGRPATQPGQIGSSADQLARERADIERFAQEERELEANEPRGLATPLTSTSTSAPATSPFFAGSGPIQGTGPVPNLLRALMLAQALGSPKALAGRGPKRPHLPL